jgi:hypothetical protein
VRWGVYDRVARPPNNNVLIGAGFLAALASRPPGLFGKGGWPVPSI